MAVPARAALVPFAGGLPAGMQISVRRDTCAVRQERLGEESHRGKRHGVFAGGSRPPADP